MGIITLLFYQGSGYLSLKQDSDLGYFGLGNPCPGIVIDLVRRRGDLSQGRQPVIAMAAFFAARSNLLTAMEERRTAERFSLIRGRSLDLESSGLAMPGGRGEIEVKLERLTNPSA